RDHATTRATHRRPWRLHTDSEQTDVVVELDAGHMQVPEPDQQVATRAVRGVVMAARSSTRRRLRQRRGLPVRCAWSPPILEASTPLTRTSRHRRAAHPHLNSEEPGIGRAFADRLASDGHDLIAVGRDDVRLGELATAYPEVAVRTIASDLSTAHGVESVISSIGDVPIDLLINNAGLAHYGSLANLLPRQVS